MCATFSLLDAKWIPIRRDDGLNDRLRVRSCLISPDEIGADHDTNPIISFAWPRPDFDLAAHELLIGLLAVAFPPNNRRDWLARFRSPPTPPELRAAFEPYASAFLLDGDAPRFLQDFSPLRAAPSPVEALFIEAPGANTIKLNKDLLVKRDRLGVLSRASAAMALYTLQQFAPLGGAGHRTSLRGGGPLVTLVVAGGSEEDRPLTLWQKLWLHVPIGKPVDRTRSALVFPWLAPTITSAKKESVSQSDADPLQALFGMPRRIRLVFEQNQSRRPCDLTGEVDDVVVTGFAAEPWGVNYGAWRHPFTPYYKIKTDILPVHAPEGRLGYRQWLGLVYESADGARIPASAIVEARSRLTDLGDGVMRRARLVAGGYAMENMKALAFAETEMPFHAVGDADLADRVSKFAERLVKSGSTAVSALGLAVRSALFGPDARIAADSTLIEAPRERLWADTERDFHDLLDEATAQLATDATGRAQTALAGRWRATLQRRALGIFDDTAPLDDFGAIDPKNVVEARRFLVLTFKGFRKMGKNLFDDLELPPAEAATGRRERTKGKTREGTPT